jgi:SAM-dependent methyltransferase
MLPEIVKEMSGDIRKIIPVLGYFQPIMVKNGYFDLVVASSAIHHSSDLGGLLQEIYRVLNADGKLVMLNETPWGFFAYFIRMIKLCVGLMILTILHRHTKISKSISADGILYDPHLGDYMHSFHQWNRAITDAGFSYSVFPTGLFSEKHQANQKVKLAHFICKKL